MNAQAKFDRAAVIEKAKNLYWEKGYHATSMRNLQDVVNMHPGSIYAAFGSKENLFKKALDRYAEESSENLNACITQEKTVLEGLKLFLRNVTIHNKGTAPSGMCMIVKSIAELTQNDHPDLLEKATSILGRIETKLANLFQKAIDNGELRTNKNPIDLARYFQVQLIGLRTYAQATTNNKVVEELIEGIFEGMVTSRQLQPLKV